MLVLTRKKGQSLNIGDNIRIVLLEVTGETVRIGIDAPAEVAVYRSEIYHAIREENRAAVVSRALSDEVKTIAFLKKSAGDKAPSKEHKENTAIK